jgi:parvulin-like peptidyl-prolyl isomerase
MPNLKTVNTKKHIAREKRERKMTRQIIILTGIVGVVIFGLILYGAISQFIIRPRTAVAEVGEKEITVRDFEKQVHYSRAQLLNQLFTYYSYYQQFPDFGASFLETAQSIASQLIQTENFGNSVLDEMINDVIIREEAAIRGITVSEDEIDDALYGAFGFYPEGTKTPTTTATIVSTPTYSETLLSLLPSTSTPTATVEATETPEVTPTLTEEVTDNGASETETAETPSEDGAEVDDSEETPAETEIPEPSPTETQTPTVTLTPTPYTTELFAEDVKEFNDLYDMYNFDLQDLREIFEVQLLRQKILEEVTQDLEPVKEEVRARHILVETEETAEEVLALLEGGEAFEDLAAAYSTDESNKDQGGDLGWFDRGTMVFEFAEAAFNLEEGEISDPVETSFGFHIIQLLGKRESQVLPDEFAQEKETAFLEWLNERLAERDDIVKNEEWPVYVPETPEVPQSLIAELFSQQSGTP